MFIGNTVECRHESTEVPVTDICIIQRPGGSLSGQHRFNQCRQRGTKRSPSAEMFHGESVANEIRRICSLSERFGRSCCGLSSVAMIVNNRLRHLQGFRFFWRAVVVTLYRTLMCAPHGLPWERTNHQRRPTSGRTDATMVELAWCRLVFTQTTLSCPSVL